MVSGNGFIIIKFKTVSIGLTRLSELPPALSYTVLVVLVHIHMVGFGGEALQGMAIEM